MRFFTQRRRLPVVPIISLIDILAILLIFFIATTTFKQKKTLLNISLPKASALSGSSTQTKRLTVSVTKDEEVFIENEAIALDKLGDALQLLKSANPEVKLELKADEELPLGVLIKVWDAFNQAGIAIKDVPARILVEKQGG